MSGMSALFECDLKKIVALSTLRQLGVIISSIGLGFVNLAFFHLITHALFKACLFVCVGVLIHLHQDRQDLRSIGNIVGETPLTRSCLTLSRLSLCGFPFISGFYSKDLIIEVSVFGNYRFIIVILYVLGTIITSSYSFRLVYSGIAGESLGSRLREVQDRRFFRGISIFMLRLGGVIAGCIIN